MAQDDGVRGDRRGAAVRDSDIEPYPALRWVGLLFKAAAVFLGVAILAELVAGLSIEGWGALPVLLGELARTLVLALVLWGAGDLVKLLIHMGHDVRAERILLARLLHRLGPGSGTAVADEADYAERTAVTTQRPPEPAAGDPTAGEEERGREAA